MRGLCLRHLHRYPEFVAGGTFFDAKIDVVTYEAEVPNLILSHNSRRIVRQIDTCLNSLK